MIDKLERLAPLLEKYKYLQEEIASLKKLAEDIAKSPPESVELSLKISKPKKIAYTEDNEVHDLAKQLGLVRTPVDTYKRMEETISDSFALRIVAWMIQERENDLNELTLKFNKYDNN